MYVNSRAIIERETVGGIEVLLQVRDRPDEPHPRWELPGGQVEEYESLLDTLAREVREETGLTLTQVLDDTGRTVMADGPWQVECLRPYCAYQTTAGPVDSVGFFFRCRAEGELVERGDGSYGHHWRPVEDLAHQLESEPEQFTWLTRAALQFYVTHR